MHACERDAPPSRPPLEWKLITNLSVDSPEQAIEKIDWYAMRWKIETLRKILKSGCSAEDLRLETAARRANVISIYCVVSWRIFWMTILNRSNPEAGPNLVFTTVELAMLDKVRPDKKESPPTLARIIIQLARLSGYLARNNDAPPGPTVIWRGLDRLRDFVFAFELARGDVGN